MAPSSAQVKVLYIGTADRRLISAEDFKSQGVEQDAVEWSEANHFCLDLPQATADFLVHLMPDQFEVVSKAAKKEDKPAE